jgi:sigma-B regulation protein RsbU (phosphoserine phosphatase)
MLIRAPLFVKIMAPLILLIFLTVGISGYWVYQESTSRWQAEMDTRLARVANLVASTVDRERLSAIRQPTDIDDPAYQQIAGRLEQAVIAANVAWIGIYYREDDYFYYWVDYDYSGVGYPFFYATPAHFAAYADRQPQPVAYTDEFGSYYGFVAPIIVTNEAGQEEVIGLVEALVDQEARTLLQQDTFSRVLPIVLIGSLIAVVLSALITVILFNQPLRRLQRGAMALAQGRFGYTIRLSSRDELGDMAETFNQMSRQLKKLYQELAEQERIQRELEIAQRVQLAIFPAEIPQVPGVTIATYFRPHRETSGDFYDLLPLGDGQIGIVIGDVSGKSIPAAMVMVAAQSIIRAEVYNFDSPAQVLDKSNTILAHRIVPGMFAAVSYARFDLNRQELIWANAGHVYPFLLHRVPPADQANYPRYLETAGFSLPLGMNDDISYEDDCLTLSPGDMILFYTDGIIEAMNPDRQIYGFERLENLVRSLPPDISPEDLIDTVLADVIAFVQEAEQHDDMTMVAVKVGGKASS